MRWFDPERQAQAALRRDLAPYNQLANATHRLVAAGIATCTEGRAGPPAHSAEVQARLLVRLSHDLRVVQLAAKRSYSLQALTLAAGIFELANAVAYIGTNLERARAWERHEETKKSYPPLSERRNAIRATLLALVPDIPDIERRTDGQEKLYSTLCMAKHGNPKALRRFGVAVVGSTVRLYHGPFVASYVVRQGRFALYHSARLVALATMVFAGPLLSGAPREAQRKYRRVERTVADQIEHLSEQVPG
jgi:hypothetical protein